MGNRYYPIGDKELASVTTITGLADKSDALIPWAVNCAVTYVLKRLKGLFKQAIKYYKRDGLLHMLLWLFAELRRILNEARTEWRTVRDEAGDIGTQVHDALEAWLKSYTEAMSDNMGSTIATIVIPGERRATELAQSAINKLMALHPFTVLATEQKVVNEEEWYAGRFDALLEVDGETWLIDFKTGASFYPEWGMQLAAYAEAWDADMRKQYALVADLGEPELPSSIDRIKVLRLDKKTLKAHWKEYGGEKDALSRNAYWTAFKGQRDAFYILRSKKKVREAWLAR